MGKKCFVPNCTSGYDSNKETIAIFSAPKDEITLKKWRKIISRKDKIFTKKDSVCEKHFKSDDIISEWSDGLNTIPLNRRRLKLGVFPTLFPNCPKYSNIETKKRRSVTKYVMPSKNIALVNENVSIKNTQVNNFTELDISLSVGNAEDTGPSKNFFELLWSREIKVKLPNELWTIYNIKGSEYCMYITFTFLTISSDKIAYIKKQVLLDEKLGISVIIHNQHYENNKFLKVIGSITQLETLIDFVNNMVICKGIVVSSEEANYNNVCKYDNITQTLRHNKCPLEVNGVEICKFCKSLRGTLRKKKSRLLQQKIMKTSKLQIQRKRNFRLRKKVTNMTTELKTLKDKIAEVNKIDLNKKIKWIKKSTSTKIINNAIN